MFPVVSLSPDLEYSLTVTSDRQPGHCPIRLSVLLPVSFSEKLRIEARAMLASGKTKEEIIRRVSAQCNQLKFDFRDISPADFVARAEARNIMNDGNPLGPSIEQLRAQGKSWSQIIESATRTGGTDFGFGGGR